VLPGILPITKLSKEKRASAGNGFNTLVELKAEIKATNDKLVSKATLTELRAACCPYNVIVQTAVEVCI
jgi:hypothetical protein